ncbi:uncharacterized protein LOC125316280 [Rhodamnia argentea]|uniref:Uncharacterized protein LOC125316280 n=1 Tax=Rhodamnia argentea TaxID=178133 RepID=A0ABM3HUH4_9MYRT|nr:uncharacterized protein LOC125316280 [Rhodamnia argentea]
MDRWFLGYKSELPCTPTGELVAEVLWFIWKARNGAIFQAKPPDPQGVVIKALAMNENVENWSRNQQENPVRARDLPSKWLPPDLGSLKINVDGAFVAGTNIGAIAGVCRDSSGVLLGGFASEVEAQSALQAKTLAIIEGLEFAAKWEREKESRVSTLEFDCLTSVQLLLGTDHAPWEVTVLIKKGQAALASLPHICLTHCPKGQNKATDWAVEAQLH